MDTSKEYILMCEKSGEIQWIWRCGEQDIYCFQGYNSPAGFHKKHEIKLVLQDHPEERPWWVCIWLPRQDQLQEMVKESNISDGYDFGLILNVMAFTAFAGCNHRRFTSMEQLWLAFVMKEKYNKTWTGTEWKSYGKKEVPQ